MAGLGLGPPKSGTVYTGSKPTNPKWCSASKLFVLTCTDAPVHAAVIGKSIYSMWSLPK